MSKGKKKKKKSMNNICNITTYKSTSSSYPILVYFPIFKKNFMKNIKKPSTADALYLDDGVGNE
jgi:hypothetical protein